MLDTAAPGSPTLLPPPGLIVPNPTGADKPSLFGLLTSGWLDLQCFIVQALTMKISVNDFKATYGNFADEAEIHGVIDAMRPVRALGERFGDPTMLIQKIQKDPAYTQNVNPPAEIYGHVVWLANRIYQTAAGFTGTISSFLELLGPGSGLSPAERAQALRDVLCGPGGLQSSASQAAQETRDLLQKMTAFDLDMQPANTTLQHYVSDSAKFKQDVTTAIGDDDRQATTFRQEADEAYTEWKNYTIAATTTSIGIAVLSGGFLLPLALGLGPGLGALAAKALEKYNDKMADMKKYEEDKQKKIRLRDDLSGFNTGISRVGGASKSFMDRLQQIEGVWNTIGMNLSYIADNFTADKLSNYPAVNQALKLDQANRDWHAIGEQAQGFTSNALVSFDLGTQYGTILKVAA